MASVIGIGRLDAPASGVTVASATAGLLGAYEVRISVYPSGGPYDSLSVWKNSTKLFDLKDIPTLISEEFISTTLSINDVISVKTNTAYSVGTMVRASVTLTSIV